MFETCSVFSRSNVLLSFLRTNCLQGMGVEDEMKRGFCPRSSICFEYPQSSMIRSLKKRRNMIKNTGLCEKIMAETILQEKETTFPEKDYGDNKKESKETCVVKTLRDAKTSISPLSLQKECFPRKTHKATNRQVYCERRLPNSYPDMAKNCTEDISFLLSHILTDGSSQSVNGKQSIDYHISTEIPEQTFIQKPTNPINVASKENDEVIQQMGKPLSGSVQNVNRLNSPASKASKSIQCSIDKPTTNSVEIHCDILSVTKNDDFSFVLDENSKLIAQQKAHIEHLKHALSSEQNKVHGLNSQLCKNQLEFDKARLNWLQKENQFKLEKDRFHRKISVVVIAKQQVSKNLEISREYIKLLKERISMLEQFYSNIIPNPLNSKHSSQKRSDYFPTERTNCKRYLKNIDSIRSTPDLSATFPTLSKLLFLSSEYQDPRKCVTPKVLQRLSNQSCQTDKRVHNYSRSEKQLISKKSQSLMINVPYLLV
ncbi:unnamed protein product [Schistosoma rodhaini]|uniref:Uncharacterized protein n=1 Tax=Schistosoma rodhaini TaxID=6188 RepID=A0AA85G254_9TREM|nr:unnamed protein product [Schistosoma rodhaini]